MIANQGFNRQVINLERSIRSLEADLRFLKRQVQAKRRVEKRGDSWWRGFWQGGRMTTTGMSSLQPIRPNRRKGERERAIEKAF